VAVFSFCSKNSPSEKRHCTRLRNLEETENGKLALSVRYPRCRYNAVLLPMSLARRHQLPARGPVPAAGVQALRRPRRLSRYQLGRAVVVGDLDLLRSAKVVLDQHGPDALIYCAQQAHRMIA
jgi:hypothetical protein